MDMYFTAIKDILVIIVPIIVAYLSYKSNKKTEKDIKFEIEKSLKEKDADTSQMLAKINAELESQKHLSSWQNSLPKTDKYVEEIGLLRHGNVAGLPDMIHKVSLYISQNDLSLDELLNIQYMLQKIKIPLEENELYPYEIPIMIDFFKLLNLTKFKIESKKEDFN